MKLRGCWNINFNPLAWAPPACEQKPPPCTRFARCGIRPFVGTGYWNVLDKSLNLLRKVPFCQDLYCTLFLPPYYQRVQSGSKIPCASILMEVILVRVRPIWKTASNRGFHYNHFQDLLLHQIQALSNRQHRKLNEEKRDMSLQNFLPTST
jgi:hypothetical protein